MVAEVDKRLILAAMLIIIRRRRRRRQLQMAYTTYTTCILGQRYISEKGAAWWIPYTRPGNEKWWQGEFFQVRLLADKYPQK